MLHEAIQHAFKFHLAQASRLKQDLLCGKQ
jgi:hypothetical protein